MLDSGNIPEHVYGVFLGTKSSTTARCFNQSEVERAFPPETGD
jgi:hypothetical protein